MKLKSQISVLNRDFSSANQYLTQAELLVAEQELSFMEQQVIAVRGDVSAADAF